VRQSQRANVAGPRLRANVLLRPNINIHHINVLIINRVTDDNFDNDSRRVIVSDAVVIASQTLE